MTSYTAAYYFDQQPGQDSLSAIVTVASIEAGHAWLIAELPAGAHKQSDGFAEVIDTVDDRAVSHHAGSLAAVLAELITPTPIRCATTVSGEELS